MSSRTGRGRRSSAPLTVATAALVSLPGCNAGTESGASFGGIDASGPVAAQAGGAPNYVTSGGGPAQTGGAPAMTASTGGDNGAGAAPISSSPALPDYDARVGFDWPESISDGGATCQAGHYAGTFQCNFIPSSGDAGVPAGTPTTPFPVTGPVELVLTESQNGEFLEVSGGTMNGSTFIAITFTAKISGKLDCQTNRFTGLVSDGQYGIQPFPPGGSFAGPTSATYSPTGPALVNGSWQFTVKDPQGAVFGTCDGTWTATYAP